MSLSLLFQRVRAFCARRFRWPFRARRPARIRCLEVNDLPASLESSFLYVVGEGEHRWYAAMVCPCGCGETLHMSLLGDARPRWQATRGCGGSATLKPSVHRRIGCQSHFFLEDGAVRWCEPESRG